MSNAAAYQLPALPYPYDALEPALPRRLVEWHHTQIHANYVETCNNAGRALDQRRKTQSALATGETARRYGYYASAVHLHGIYWNHLAPKGKRRPDGPLMAAIQRDFGSYDRWIQNFILTASVPRNGWALLVQDPVDNRLRNFAISGHDVGGVWSGAVLVACDLWEHAYYPQYGPYRGDYVRAFIDLLNWEPIGQRFDEKRLGERKVASREWGSHQKVPLSFGYDALRGVSAQVLRWHHDRDYGGLVRERNELERRLVELEEGALEHYPGEFAELKGQEPVLAANQQLHELYWRELGGGGGRPSGELLGAMERAFDSYKGWLDAFKQAARANDAGWIVLTWDRTARRLDNVPVDRQYAGTRWEGTALLAIDLFEHAYYYDRGPDRSAYLEAFFQNIHWREVERRFANRL